MTPQTDTDAQLKVMVEPHPQQELVDTLSALVLTGKVDFYAAKAATECEDWERARELIEEAI
jgi:hypothetical protein